MDSGERSVRVLVIDDHPTAPDDMTRADRDIVSYSSTAAEAPTVAAGLQPDLVLLDRHLGTVSAAALARSVLLAAPSARIAVFTTFPEHASGVLTPREHDVLRRVALGQSNPEIAAGMYLSRNTVKSYLQNTLHKLGARNRVEAIAMARELGLL